MNGFRVLFVAAALLSSTFSQAATPDPTLLPVATTSQVPMTSAYNALNVPGLTAGSSYPDPQTGVKVYKLTSSGFPVAGYSFTHDYAEGGEEISLPLNSSGTRAIHVYTGDGNQWLIDFTPGAGVSNVRSLSTSAFPPFMNLCSTFSNNAATPWYMYISQGATIRRVDIRTMTEVTGGGWPVTGETDAMWLHQNENDSFFTWMRGANGSTIVGYEPATGTKKTYTNGGLNEPRIDRDATDRFVCVSMSTPQNQGIFWDWRSNAVTWSSPVQSYGGDPPVAHQASLRGYWVGVNWDQSYPWQFYKISATPNSVQQPLAGGAAQGGGHCDGNWNQHPANPDDQWFACYYYGELAPPSTQGAVAPGGILLSTANGQRRILAHLYNTSTDYTYYSFAKLASDGAYVLFTSNMNGSARSDLFLAQLPTSGITPPPPPPDTTPPTIAITSPANGATVSATITVSANASDNVGVVGVQFLLDGANLGVENTSSTFTTSWNTTTSTNGSHTITAVARDAAGNRTTSAPVTVTVANSAPDTTPPVVTITAPVNGATVSATVTISANASDNVAVAGVQFLVDAVARGAEVTTAPYTTSWNTTTATNGAHTITAVARDAAGNRTTSAGVTVTVSNTTADTTPPTVPTGVTAVVMSSSQINLSWTASSDSQSGVAGYKVFRGGTQIATSASTSYSDSGLSAATTYTYTVAAYDVAGNSSVQSASVSATTQSSAPPPPPAGNIMLLHFDENAGSTLFADASGAGNNGSCAGTGCPTAGVAGKVGKALSFDGLTNFVSVRHNSGLNAFPLTVATWFKTASTSGVVGLVNKYTAGSYNGYNVFMNNGNVCAWYIKDNSNYVYDGTGCTFNVAGYNDNAWHHVVYVVDSSGGKLYLDGAPKATPNAWTGVAGSTTTTQDVHIGHYPGAFGGAEYFPGLLDEVRIYNTALTASEVSALYAANNQPPADTTPPTVSISAPANGATVSSTVTVSANASDDTGVVGVQFLLDGANLGAEDTSASFATSWNTTTSANGAHTIAAVARDAAGNRTTSAAITVTVANPVPDTTPPTIAISAPANGATVSATVNITATASDNVGVVGVQFVLDGANLGAENTSASFATSWNTTTSANGSHTITAVARDAAGNRTTATPITVIVANTVPDTTPPTIAITAPANGATVSATITISANASDNVGVVGVQFLLDGANLGAEDMSASYTASWNTTTSVNGSHTITAVARDAAGNRTTSAPVNVTVSNPVPDTTPPTVPTGLGAIVMSSSQINLSWSASSDAQSGVAGYKIFRGGTQIATSASTSYSDTGLSAATTYTYSVAAYDVAGNSSAQSAGVSATTQSSAPPPPPAGNIMLLHLDENAGSTLFTDASGTGNNGSCAGSGCPTAGVAGKLGKALSFDGVADLVTVTHNSGLNAFPLTVATWFKTGSTSGVVGLVNKYAAGSYNGYNVFMNNGNVCAWYIKDASNFVYDGSGCTFNVAGFNDNAWHQLVYVVDSAGGKLYLDGAQKAATTSWTGAAGSPTTTQDVHIGHYPGAFGGAEYFAGLLDEVRIYNIALTASDVSALYAANNPPPADTTPPSVAITAPASGATVSATVTVSANASDDVGVAGVQFLLDGAALGAEDTIAPFTTSWNTTTAANGNHTISAVARDAAGNRTTAAAVPVSVANGVPNTVPPNVSITAPANGATVSGTIQISAAASGNVSLAGVQFYINSQVLGVEDTTAPFTASWNTLTAANGSNTITAIARNAAGQTATATITVSVANPIVESPFRGAPASLPGRIEAEDFDRGGEALAYHDLTPGNQGGYYRTTEDVDIINPYANGYVVNDFQSGEWLKYTISVAQSGTYKIQALVSSAAGNSRFHIEIDGVNVTGLQSVPNTGSFGSFTWVGPSGINLTAGQHVLKVVADQQMFNFDAISAALEVAAPTKSRGVRH